MSRGSLVSIIIPVYNAARWLSDTLESALSQTWPNIEIIVVDDGSRDDSLTIARRYESSRLKVVSQENKGASAARNRALELAQGDYLQYLDADDLLSPEKISAQITLLQSCGSTMLGTCGAYYFQDGTPPASGRRVDGWPMVDSDDPVDWLIGLYGGYDGVGAMVPPACWLVPRALTEKAGYWDEACLVDNDGEYFCRVVLSSQGIRRVDQVYSFYRNYTFRISLSGAKSRRHLLGLMYSQDRKAAHLLARTDNPRAKKGLACCYLAKAVAAYPFCPEASQYGLSRAHDLDPTITIPRLGRKSEIVRRFFGWKAARYCSAWTATLRQILQRS